MGYFGIFEFHDGAWKEHDDIPEPATAEPWLLVNVHDSDMAMIDYTPKGRGSGQAIIGSPLTVFDSDQKVLTREDSEREAAGLTDWWAGRHQITTPEPQADKERELVPFFAEDDKESDLDDLGDIFVEVKVGRFLAALGLPEIERLPDWE